MVYIIAEAGVNHNGVKEIALELIQLAKTSGANAVKFQLFHADTITTRQAEQALYQKKAYQDATSQHEMLKMLELSYDCFSVLHEYAKKLAIDFIITPFDVESLDFITRQLHLPLVKFGSSDLTNGPLLLAGGSSNRKIILSTGMSTLAEVEAALKVIAFGWLKKCSPESTKSLEAVYASQEAQQILKENVTLLHCTSEYPAPPDEVNLRAMDTLSFAFGLPVGLSDHTLGIEVSLAAVAREAKVIEKHFTLDKMMKGPDHVASLDGDELKMLVKGIRKVEGALGNGRKLPTQSEAHNKDLVRRTIVAKRAISHGEIFSDANLAIKRPDKGISPMHYWEMLGKKAEKDYVPDEVILL